MKNKDKIIKLKKIRTLAVTFGASAIFGLTGCRKEEDKSFEEVLESIEDSTCLDEVLSKNDTELLDNITKLEDYIKLSNKLNKEKIEKMYITEEQLKGETLLGIEEIEKLLSEYNEDKTNEEKLFKLNIQQKLVNNFIVSKGYEYTSELGIWVLKSKIADSYKVNTDISTDIAESITILSKSDMRYDLSDPNNFEKYIKVGTGNVKINTDYSNLLSNIYTLQEYSGNTGYLYNGDRNDLLENSINNMERILIKEYKLKLK